MEGKIKDRSYIQCLNCGNIYIVERKIPMSDAIVKMICPACNHNRGLHCGYNEDDVSELKDYFLDKRFLNY